MDTNAKLYQDLDCVLLTRDQIAARIKEMGAKITRDFEGKPLLCICVLKGSVVFFSDLMREIELPLEIDFISLSSYGAGTESSGIITERSSLTRDITGRHLLIVEDIVDSGRTLTYLKEHLKKSTAASVSICTLLDKPARRQTDLVPDYSGFTIEDAFVVGYGLDYDEKYRNLPDVGVLSPRIYKGE
ncbi:MAG: hypoxanthine phosphoribosyltransferase [Clostridiales bacterium]|nr:hypoxanthine phosphoribosyltransferase [Clostridiales bacterium]